MPDSLLFLTILFCSYPLFTPPGPDLSNNNEHNNNEHNNNAHSNETKQHYKINQLPCTICTLKSKHLSILERFMQNYKLQYMQKSKLGFYPAHLVTHAEDCAVSGRVGIYVVIKPDFCLHHVLVSIFGLELFKRNRSAIKNALV